MAKGLSQTDLGEVSGSTVSIAPTERVTYSGNPIPTDSLLHYQTGQHDGANNASALSHVGAFTGKTYSNLRVRNITDRSEATISSHTNDVVTATLSGGTDDDWDTADAYDIVMDIDSGDIIQYQSVSDQGGAVTVSATGVPLISGSNGTHTFQVTILDASDSFNASSYFTVTLSV